jgi:uracil-DNA glycosylase family 4
MTLERTQAARELLAFYVEAGVDAVVGEQPVDRFADVAPAVAAESRAGSPAAGGMSAEPAARRPPLSPLQPKGEEIRPDARNGMAPAVALSPDAAVMAAREAARSAATLDGLRAILDRFEGCTLRATATQLVFADGSPEGRVMFVGEAPGREEDLEGRAFVGRSGKLLDLMMTAIGLDRTGAYIANVIPWRPPGNRTPTPQETQICLPFIKRQIELANPDILVCLGQPATAALLNVQGIMKNRGRWFPYHTGTREIRAIASLHPAYLLRQPLHKRLAWRDFLMIRKELAEAPVVRANDAGN